jgi:hypothetical protein
VSVRKHHENFYNPDNYYFLILPKFSYADGNILLEQCLSAEKGFDTNETQDPLNIGMCLGLVQGGRNAMDIMSENSKFKACFPKGGIRNDQGVRIVLSYLKSNPAFLHEDEVALTMLAFIDAYPCK